MPRRFSSLPHAAAVLVGAGDAGVARAQAEPRARAHRRRHLAAAEDLLPLDLHLGERAERLRIAGEEVDVVDGVGADADDVPVRCAVAKLGGQSSAGV